MIGVYLGARKHRLPGYDILYNDIKYFDGIDFVCDMLEIDLSDFDFVIATPPCNYYSRANYRRETSKIAQETKHLLPDILDKLKSYDGFFLVENVCNKTLLPRSDYFEFNFGQNHFYTNVPLIVPSKDKAVKQNKNYIAPSRRNLNYNVDLIIKLFLVTIGA